MERKWLELPTMGEAFCISKRPFIITRSAYAGHSVIRLLGRVIMLPLGTFMDCKYTSAKNVNFGMGFTGSDIGGFAEQPSGDLY
jgi:alpha-glucosidase